MKRIYDTLKATVYASVAFLLCAGAMLLSPSEASAAKKSNAINSFANPDFAYPVTVERNARSELNKSMISGRWENAVLAVMQIAKAEESVSSDAVKIPALMDSVALQLPFPYKNIMFALEARYYSTLYNRNSRRFSQRMLPADSLPANPLEWSREMFARKVIQLSGLSLSGAESLLAVSSKKIEKLLDNPSSQQLECWPSVFSVLVWSAIDNLSPFFEKKHEIPFFSVVKDESELSQAVDICCDALSFIEARTDRKSPANIFARLRLFDFLPANDRVEQLLSLIEETADSEYMAFPFCMLMEKAGGCDQLKRKLLATGEKYLSLFAESKYAPMVRNLVLNISSIDIRMFPRAQYLSSDSIRINGRSQNGKDFYVLLFRKDRIQPDDDNLTLKQLIARSSFVDAVKVRIDSVVPFETDFKVCFPPRKYGEYFIVPSKTADKSGIYSNLLTSRHVETFRVGDMAALVSAGSDGNSRILVASGHNFSPLAGIDVSAEYLSGSKNTVHSGVTDSNGLVSFPGFKRNGYRVNVRNGEDRLDFRASVPYIYTAHTDSCASVYTDLSVYHPGDSIRFAVIAYTAGKNPSVIKEKQMKINLIDANYRKCDSLTVITDKFGRASGILHVPSSGLLGKFYVEAEGLNGTSYIQVAEYVMPTFFVHIDSVADAAMPGDSIRISGTVTTYSGMPLQDADIKYHIRYEVPFWRVVFAERALSGATYEASSVTDSDGRFTIVLPVENLIGTPYERGIYILSVAATSQAGETQESSKTLFSLGKGCGLRLEPDIPDRIKITDDFIELRVNVADILGNSVPSNIKYSVSDSSGKTVSTGIFSNPKLRLPSDIFPSGEYRFTFALSDLPGDSVNVSTVIYRSDDAVPPVKTALWIPDSKIVAKHYSENVPVTVGSGYPDSYIYYEIHKGAEFIRSGFIHSDASMEFLYVEVPRQGECIYVDFSAIHNLEEGAGRVTVYPVEASQALKIQTISFRDKINSASHETWSFRFNVSADDVNGRLPALAVMTDEALDAVSFFNWRNPFVGARRYDAAPSPHLWNPGNVCYSWDLSPYNRIYPDGSVSAPVLDPYGFRNIHYVFDSVRNSVALRKTYAMVETYAYRIESADDTAYESSETGESGSDMELRPVECPSAFFMPSLLTDEDGLLTIEFTVPDYNTTWKAQILGYSDNMLSDVAVLRTVASRPVMTKLIAPRFLRSGDKAKLSATIFNNSDDERDIDVRMELVSPVDRKVILTAEKRITGMAMRSSAVADILVEVPSDCESLIVRVYAKSEDFSDGEQILVGILPSSSPVVESTPFYSGDSYDIFVVLPQIDSDAAVALQYCANPVWYALTALPGIKHSSSVCPTAVAQSIYAHSLALMLAERYPQIKDAIKYWTDDYVELSSTPWLISAESENAGIKGLKLLLDEISSRQKIATELKRLSELQSASGGWGWTPESRPSLWVTTEILKYYGMMNVAEALPDDARNQVYKAIEYCDREWLKNYKKSRGDKISVSLLRYLYVRSFFEHNAGSGFASLKKYALSHIADEWGDYSVYDKAVAAVVLHRGNYGREALKILESIRQFAVVTNERGAFFDNPALGNMAMPRVVTSVMALNAFDEISPDNPFAAMLRQWILLSRQTENWQYGPCVPMLVYSLISSGAEWLGMDSDAKVTLNDKTIDIPIRDRFTGAFTVSLNAKEASGAHLKISRKANVPSWGGVISQRILPMKDVRSKGIPGLAISKEVYRISGDGVVEKSSNVKLRMGDRLRITLTITSDRDADYVTVVDERPACVGMTDQLSGYVYNSGVSYYKEVGESNTTLFFDRITKGVTQISYDCFVSSSGDFSSGIATVQSQCSPLFTAHSAGMILHVASE